MGTTPTQRTMSTRDWAMLLLLGSIWGGSFFFARIAVLEIPPLNLVFFRVAIAAITLHIYLAMAGISFRPFFQMFGSFLLLALVNNVLPFSLMFAGQTELGAGAASILNATTPFWTMILASLFAIEKLSINKIVGVLIGMAGTAVMVGPGIVAGLGGPVWAKMALIGTAMTYACAFLYARKFSTLAPQIVATGQMTASTLIMVPVVLLWHGPDNLFNASGAAWASVVGLAVLATSFAYILYFSILRSAGVTNASLVTLIVPVSAILLGALFLGEKLESFEIAGMALIAIGLITIDGRIFKKK